MNTIIFPPHNSRVNESQEAFKFWRTRISPPRSPNSVKLKLCTITMDQTRHRWLPVLALNACHFNSLFVVGFMISLLLWSLSTILNRLTFSFCSTSSPSPLTIPTKDQQDTRVHGQEGLRCENVEGRIVPLSTIPFHELIVHVKSPIRCF